MLSIYNKKHMKLPIKVKSKVIGLFNAIGFSFLIWIFIHPNTPKYKLEKLINHETIHFRQQLELLFVLHWVLYILFYFINLIFIYQNHRKAYRNNPFEVEANKYEDDLKNRKIYGWVQYIF